MSRLHQVLCRLYHASSGLRLAQCWGTPSWGVSLVQLHLGGMQDRILRPQHSQHSALASMQACWKCTCLTNRPLTGQGTAARVTQHQRQCSRCTDCRLPGLVSKLHAVLAGVHTFGWIRPREVKGDPVSARSNNPLEDRRGSPSSPKASELVRLGRLLLSCSVQRGSA